MLNFELVYCQTPYLCCAVILLEVEQIMPDCFIKWMSSSEKNHLCSRFALSGCCTFLAREAFFFFLIYNLVIICLSIFFFCQRQSRILSTIYLKSDKYRRKRSLISLKIKLFLQSSWILYFKLNIQYFSAWICVFYLLGSF